MRFTRAVGATAVLLCLISTATPALAMYSSSDVVRADGSIPGSYIVVLRDARPDNTVRIARSLARSVEGKLEHVYTHALQGFSLVATPDQAARLSRDDRVAHVEQDSVMRAVATQANPPWGLDRSDQRDLPLNQSFSYNAAGSGVRAYVIDTGIRISHADFGGRASYGRDTIDGDDVSSDCNGHGTHVAGTIGGLNYGIAKSASLVAVRVLNCAGTGPTSGVIAGVDWVTGNAVRPAVANMSLGGGTSSALDTAVRNSINSGITYSLAAGNGNILGMAESACNTSPSRVAEGITVSATDSSDRKASWANYGTCVDLFAPGVGITSSWYTSDTATNSISGTSMAAPHVAGAAAAFLETNPSASPATVASALVNESTAGKVSNAGSGSPNRLLYTGFISGGGGGGGNTPPSAGFGYSCSELTCSFTDQSSDVDGSIASRTWSFGDGAGSTEVNPTHAYGAAGNYTVTLTVTDDAGASSSASQSVAVSTSADPDPGTPTLSNGVATSDRNGAAGTWKYYKIQVPAGRSQLRVDLSGAASCGLLSCNPDLDLFVRRGAKPTTGSYACKSESNSANESCTVSSPAADWWYVGIYVYSGSASISYQVKATY